MPNRDVIVIGGSLGSADAIRPIVRSIPPDFGAMLFIAVHRSDSHGLDHLPNVLSRLTQTPVHAITRGQATETGNIYIAPPTGHLMIRPGSVLIERNATTTSRTSIDSMFRTAAQAYGDRVIAVILSGMLQDGTAGFWEIRKHGGITIAQDLKEAEEISMPQSAMRNVPVDYCLRAAEIGPKLLQLVEGSTSAPLSVGARIMIVEDEWLFASELQEQLTALRYEVAALVASGEEALSKAESAHPDVAIMDVGLAGMMKGTETAERLWKQFRIPSIFLTGYMDQETLLAAEDSMPCAFLPKPHQAAHLHATIQIALARRKRDLTPNNP